MGVGLNRAGLGAPCHHSDSTSADTVPRREQIRRDHRSHVSLRPLLELVQRTKGNRGGTQFVAINDPGTGLEQLASERGFWRTFTNPPDIGGRYSVLSSFGLVPAALLGMDVGKLLARALAMREACRKPSPVKQNPGAALGAMREP